MPLTRTDNLALAFRQRAMLKPSVRFSGEMGRMGRMVCVHCGIHSTPAAACRSCGGDLVAIEHAGRRRLAARWRTPATRFTAPKW